MDDEVLNELVSKLLQKLQSTSILVDRDSEVSAKISNEGELLVGMRDVEKANLAKWSISLENAVPTTNNSFFCIIKNNSEIPIKLMHINLSASIGGVQDSIVTLHRITGDLEFLNPEQIELVEMTTTDTELNVSVLKVNDILGITESKQVSRLDISNSFETHNMFSMVTISTGNSIALRWGAAIGSISGTLVVQAEV